MTISEFNAWLDGFEAAFDGAPTKAQWLDIRAKFSEVVRDEKLHTVPAQPMQPVVVPGSGFPWATTWSENLCRN